MQGSYSQGPMTEDFESLSLAAATSFPLIPGIISAVSTYLDESDLQRYRLVGRHIAESASSRCRDLIIELPLSPRLATDVFVKQADTVHAIVRSADQVNQAWYGLQQLLQQLPALDSLRVSTSAVQQVILNAVYEFALPAACASTFSHLTRLDLVCTGPLHVGGLCNLVLPCNVTLSTLNALCFKLDIQFSDPEQRGMKPGHMHLHQISAFAPNLQYLHVDGELVVSEVSELRNLTHLGVGQLEVVDQSPSNFIASVSHFATAVRHAQSATAVGQYLQHAFPLLEVLTAFGCIQFSMSIGPGSPQLELPMGLVLQHMKSLRAINAVCTRPYFNPGPFTGDLDGLQRLSLLTRLTLDCQNHPSSPVQFLGPNQPQLGQLTQLKHLQLAGIGPSFMSEYTQALQLPNLETLAVPAGLLCWQCHIQPAWHGALPDVHSLMSSLRQLRSLQKILFIAQEGQPVCPEPSHLANNGAGGVSMLSRSLDYFKAALAAGTAFGGPQLQVDLVQLTAAECESCPWVGRGGQGRQQQ